MKTIKANITVLKNGGRTTPFQSGYRPTFDIGKIPMLTVQSTFLIKKPLNQAKVLWLK